MENEFKWLTVKLASQKYGVSISGIHKKLEADGIPSAVKIDCHWYIPDDLDVSLFAKRKTGGDYNTKTPAAITVMEDYTTIGTLDGVADKYGVTKERVRQVLRKNFGNYKDLKPLPENMKCTVCGGKKPWGRTKWCSKECADKAIKEKWAAPEKVCNVCKLPKPRRRFTLSNKDDGIGRTRTSCNDCQLSENKAKYALRKHGLLPIERVGDGKNCTKCGDWGEWDKFNAQFVNKDGKKSWCKKCEAEYVPPKRHGVDDRSLSEE